MIMLSSYEWLFLVQGEKMKKKICGYQKMMQLITKYI